jgi:Na+/proline symporter
MSPEQVGTNQEAAYPIMAMTYLPSGLRGILFVALLAAFMSTISTLINFGASYVVNDLYKRFLVRTREDGHYVNVSRVVTALMAVGGALVSYASDSVLQLLTIAGAFTIGAVLIPLLRWFWWRMSAWGEFAGFVVSVVVVVLMLGFKAFDPLVAEWLPLSDAAGKAKAFSSDWDYYGLRILVVMIPCTLAAVVTSLLTRPADAVTLRRFIQLLRPPAFAWRRVADRLGVAYEPGETGGRILGGWLAMTVCIASLLFCIGDLCLGRSVAGGIELVVFLLAMVVCLRMSAGARAGAQSRE